MRQTPKPHKVATVETLKKKIAESNMIVFTNYRSMTVAQITDLRRKLRAVNGDYKVIKNTLFIKALVNSGMEVQMDEDLTGPIAALFAKADPIAPTKILYKFRKDNEEKPEIRGGIFGNQILAIKDVDRLSKLPSREELLAKAVGSIASPLYGIVNVLQGPIRKFVYALEAIKKTKPNA